MLHTTVKGDLGDINFRFRGFSPNNEILLTTDGSSFKNTLNVWNVEDGENLLAINSESVGNVVFTDDSQRLAIGGHSYLLKDRTYDVDIWNIETGRLEAKVQDKAIATFSLSPDGQTLATGNAENEIKIWKIK